MYVSCFIWKKVHILLLLILILLSVNGSAQAIVSPNIIINLPSRTLELYSGTTLIKEYPVAVGKASTPTPLGEFRIDNKECNPTWIPPNRDYIVLSGPDNPLGYRWMGFFSSYGIHGTNAPWAIGTAVSNGCVRMREEDAEELFDIVTEGTPVKIIYERIKVGIDNNGQASICVYPDIYDCKPISLAEAKRKLDKYGCRDLISDDIVLQMIQESSGKQVPIARFHNIKINGKILSAQAVSIGGNIYLPVWAVAVANGSNIIWDERNQLVWKEMHVVNGLVRGDVIFCKVEDIQKLFGMQKVIKKEENLLELNVFSLAVNGKMIGAKIDIVDGVLSIPGILLAESLGKNAKLDLLQNHFTVEGHDVPFTFIDGQSYIKITNIKEYFKANVVVNQKEHVIEITN